MRGEPDLRKLSGSLANAWGTELLIILSGRYASGDELLRLSNNWAAVQTYYVFYHAAQALAVANDMPRPQGHPSTQRVFMSSWATRNVSLPPWSLAAAHSKYLNLPPGRLIDDDIHPWTRCDKETCWDLSAKALRTTRGDAILLAIRQKREAKRKGRRKAWEAKEAQRIAKGGRQRTSPRFPLPQLNQAEKSTVESNVRPRTLMDYLFRLRIKSNYEEARMFTEGPPDDVSSRRVHRDLRFLASSTMLLHELHIRQIIGIKEMSRLVDDWLLMNTPPGTELGLASRRNLVLAP